MKLYPLSIILIVLLTASCVKSRVRIAEDINSGWEFQKKMDYQGYVKEFSDERWREVSVPHDWAIEASGVITIDANTGRLPWKGEGWYRTNLDVPEKYLGKIIYLLFDGVMAFPSVYINDELAGRWDYGYNSFYLDITDHVKFGENNKLSVHVDTRKHDSRWYPGAGIYRKVRMIVVNPVHIDIWGTYVTTPRISKHEADIDIEISISNTSDHEKEVVVVTNIISGDDKVAEGESAHRVPPGKAYTFNQSIVLKSPELWDIENPHLYTLETTLFIDGRRIDDYLTSFGVREMYFTADDGFHLNGRRVQLKGVNLHHDHGILGAAFNERAMERQLEIMMDMGCNAIRTSHNTAAPEVLDLCDRMGILVFNEVFDKYDGKADITDTTDFESFAHRNIRNFVVRDRNHPSVFIWSVGNEIGDVQWDIDSGFYKLQTMLDYVAMYDNTRPTTLVCDSKESATLRHFDFYDIHAWNYGRRYSLARELEPNKSVIISESASTLSTRGYYEFPLPEEKTDFTGTMQISSYDLHAPWWAELADDDFMWQEQEPYIAGEFVWTGFDYLGEPTPYNQQYYLERGEDPNLASFSSYFGIVDYCGIPKDRYYLYKSYWKPEETTIHILPHWNWPERIGMNVPVFVYTNGDSAELFLNGKSLGRRTKKADSDISTERFRLMWNEVIYEPGVLKVIAYKDGQKLGESYMISTGDAVAFRLTPDRDRIKADGKDLSFVLVELVDENGYACPYGFHEIHLDLEGPGTIVGAGNGNPRMLPSLNLSKASFSYGKAMVVISSNERGTIQLTASGSELESHTIKIRSK